MFIYLNMIQSEEDKNKFEEIYTSDRQTMFYLANRIVRDQYLAEDIVHQAFLKIIDNLDKINEINCHKTKGYILVIVENLSIGFYRKRKSVEAYRLKIFEVITKVWEEFTSITFKSEEEINDGNLVPANPEYIPEGFSIVEENLDDYMNMIIYTNTDNIEIFYEQSFSI